MRPPVILLNTLITRDTSDLRISEGFWSDKKVFFNSGNKVVIVDSLFNSLDLEKICRQIYQDNIKNEIAKRFDICVGLSGGSLERALLEVNSPLRVWFPFSAFNTFHGLTALDRGTKSCTWKMFLEWLDQNYSRNRAQQRSFMIDEIARFLKKSSDWMPRLNGSSTSWLHLGKSEFTELLRILSSRSFDEAVAVLCISRQFVWNTHSNGKDKDWAIKNNGHVLSVLRKLDVSCATLATVSDGLSLLNIANAAELVLGYLVQRNVILLPESRVIFKEACRRVAPHWPWNELSRNNWCPLLQLFVSSTNIRDPYDIPGNLKLWISGFRESYHGYGLTRYLVEPIQRENAALKPWPVSDLHGTRRQGAKPQNEVWSPKAISQTYGRAWGQFATLVFQTNESGRAHSRAALRNIVQWANQRGVLSPADIKIRDLLDPAALQTTYTFKQFLASMILSGRISTGTAWSYWHEVAHAFGKVVNRLKITPDSIINIKENPFDALENPFNIKQINKTSRRRLPSSIHDAMIDVLLDVDNTGTPTYRWAMTVCSRDSFESHSYGGEQSRQVWCPSRCALLALLLLLPVRAKQARWLDRGLLDEKIWDIGLHRYVKNKHILRAWRYKDGSTHQQRYGRPSGVLQPLVDSMLDKEEIGIFINTNKTQMWDPSSRRGYELPWPNIRGGHESSIATKTAFWLNRPYALIEKQITWMNEYYPDPMPISFGDSIVDKMHVNDKYINMLPVFTPLFSDLSVEYYKDDGKHTRYYLPVSHNKLYKLFNALSVETEKRLAAEGRFVQLTQAGTSSSSYEGRIGTYEIHGLRVAGISRLIEMGVPVSIVQEFVAGHATAVMTMYYCKAEPGAFKMKLVEALQRSGVVHEWERYQEQLSAQKTLWTFNRRYARHRDDDILEQCTSWKTVPGGICPVGGSACHIGIPSEEEAPDKIARHYSPVEGGCGNCRFFSTGPAFLIQQGQAMNELMLELRMLGRERKDLYGALSELSWEDVSDLAEAERHKLVFNRQLIKENIADLDRKSEPLILEWINRYRMYTESSRLASTWEELKVKNPPMPGHFLLVSGESADQLKHEVEVRFEKSGDFGLIRNILDSANIQGGLEKASSLSKEICSQFMDRILRIENCRYLLMDIQDDRLRHKAAYLMSAMVEQLIGKESVQQTLDQHTPLELSKEQREDFHRWVAATIADAMPAGQRVLRDKSNRRSRRIDHG